MTHLSGALDRSLAALTIGLDMERAQREHALQDVAQAEFLQVIRVPLAGTAFSTWCFADKDVKWEMPFLYAPQQRQVPFETPHFGVGFEFTTSTTSLVILQAHVLDWVVTEEGWFVGAQMRFASCAPLATRTTVRWGATAHLWFQGYATNAEGDDFQ